MTERMPAGSKGDGYNVYIIRDFLTHLLRDVRVSLAEQTSLAPEQTHPELVEQLQGCMAKWGVPVLMAADALKISDSSSEEIEEARVLLRVGRARQLKTIEHFLVANVKVPDDRRTGNENG